MQNPTNRREPRATLNWAARLSEHQAKTFVGRVAELQLFRQVLHARQPSFQVLAVLGPPGCGKTTLLKRFVAECETIGVSHRLMDARSIDPIQTAFVRALRLVLDLADDEEMGSTLSQRGRFILMIDNYDRLYPLHDWLCDTILPQLPASTIVVVASREPLPDIWRSDPAWRNLVQAVTLHNFSPEETRAYLSLRAVPDDEHERLIQFSRGHPLALSLAADLYDQPSTFSFNPRSAPDVMQTLVRRFVGDVTDPKRRKALEASAIVRVSTEAVLAAMLEQEDLRSEYEWLCTLSFIDFSPNGIYPHDLVRDALTWDLLWRDPHRYEELRRRARDFYLPLLSHPDQDIQGEALADYLFLHRNHEALRPFLNRHGNEALLPKTEPATPTDYPEMLALVEHHEGEPSGKWLDHWLRHQPEGAWVIRGNNGQIEAFTLIVRLDHSSEESVCQDPFTRALWDYLQGNQLLQPGDTATVSRFVIDAEAYQGITPHIASLALFLLHHCLTVPNLKFTFNILSCPERWEPFATASGFFRPMSDLRLEINNRDFGVFMQDWRYESPRMWLERIAPEHHQKKDVRVMTTPDVPDDHQLLTQRNEFASAVRHALKNFHVPDVLAKNPLINSALIVSNVGGAANSEHKTRALQNAITDVIEFLGTVPKRKRYYHALRYTYLEPRGSQEQVAEWLDLPFSTYRGHLRNGVDVVTDILWQKDVDARSIMHRQSSPQANLR